MSDTPKLSSSPPPAQTIDTSDAKDNSFGIHLLVDYGAIEEADSLLSECEQYIEATKSAEFFLPFVASFSRLASNVRQWRMKRKDTKMQTLYDTLAPRITMLEKKLRHIIGEVVEKKGVLRLQAKYLQNRLEFCVEHNAKLLDSTQLPLDETRDVVNQVSSELSTVKFMFAFNQEVNRLKAVEDTVKKSSVMRWGGAYSSKGKGRAFIKPNKNAEADIPKDEELKLVEERLLLTREVREKTVLYLQSILEKRGIQQSNLDNCSWALDALRTATKRDGLSGLKEGSEEEEANLATWTDHSRCADCAHGYSVACDCISHLSALQKQAHDASQRLQLLVEMRERMLEAYEIMIRNQNEQGGSSGGSGAPNSPMMPTDET